MSDICKIDFSSLKNSESIFKDELNNFNYKTYTTFSSCYLRKIPNDYLEKMSDELQKLYDQIKDGYNNIDKWWNDYIENFESLEDYLADINYVDCISEPLIRDNAKQLPELKDFNLDSPEIVIVNADDSESKLEFKDNEVNSSTTDYYSTSSESDISDVNAGKVVEEYKMDDKVSEAVSEETVVSDEWETKDLSEIELSDGVGAIIAAGVSVLGDVLKWWDDTTEGVSNWFDDVGAFVSGGVKSLWSSVTDWWSDTTQFVDGWFDDVSVFVSDGVESLLSSVTDWWSDVTDWWSSDALPWIQKAADAVWDVVKSTGATVAVLVQSLVEGVLQFGEGIVDLAVLLGTGVCSLFTGAADIVQAVNAFFTDEEWSSYTIAMWEGTKGFVSKEYVTGWFDSLYQDTAYGQWLAENSFFFDTTRSIASGVGYISGAVLLSIATFGVGSVVTSGGTLSFSAATAATSSAEMAVTATAAGIGRGTQNAWNNGADLVEGLVAGTFNGLWEGLQFYIGGKINGLKVFGTDGILKTIQFSDIKTQLLNSLSHVILDGIDAGVEGFVIPFIDSLYKDGYYDENGNYIEFTENQSVLERYSELFDDNGGWSTVLTQASIGSVASLIGEAFSLRKYFKDSKAVSDITTPQSSGTILSSLSAKKFDEYDDFVAYYRKQTIEWSNTLTDEELNLIWNYIDESNFSSYATMNSVLRDIAIDKEAKTITLYHFDHVDVFTFDEWTKMYNETIDQFITRTYDEAITLNNAISRSTFIEDTVICRGVDGNALSRFGITMQDSPEEIMKKLGSVYTDKGFMSCTPVAGGGFLYKDINFVMTCKKGMAVGEFSLWNAGEQEVLLGLGSKFSVDSVEKIGGKIMIYMTSLN